MYPTRRSFIRGAAAALASTTIPFKAFGLPSIGGRAFGSYWRLALADQPDLAGLGDSIGAIIEEVDAAMSPYRAASELSRLNTNDSTDWQPLSAKLSTVLNSTLRTADASNGAFDPTVGPIVGRYGFGPIRGTRVGDVGDLELRGDALRRSKPGVSLDLCGIAKGYALDRIVTGLEAQGVQRFLIELGGEVCARGHHPKGRPWRVAIDGTGNALTLDNLAVATSGNAAQNYGVGENRYGHIINPHNGTPATGDLLSVSVISHSGMKADAWATALFSSGTDGALDMAEANDLATVLVVRDGDTQRVMTTGAARRYLLS